MAAPPGESKLFREALVPTQGEAERAEKEAERLAKEAAQAEVRRLRAALERQRRGA